MAGERIDYTAAAVDAAKSVLIELMHILGEYRDDMVLVGGWISAATTGYRMSREFLRKQGGR